ncbi:MAG: transporter substrate-binding domain-containing protein, partial [Gemmatimonadales bacterium]
MRLPSILSILALSAALGCGGERPSRPPAADTRPQPVSPAPRQDSLSSPTVSEVGRLVSERWTFDLDSMVKRRVIRVLVPASRTLYFEDRGRLRGISYDAVQEFERTLNQKLRTGALPIECIMIPVPRDQLISRLQQGRGDLAVGTIPVTPERQLRVDFSDPVYQNVREVVVTGPGAPALRSRSDLAGREIYVRTSSSYAEHLRTSGIRPMVLRPADESLEDGDILELVNTGVVPITVVDSATAGFYRSILRGLTVRNDLEISSGGSFAWAMRKGTPQLRAAVNDFVREHRVGTLFGNIVARRYLKDNPWIRNPARPEDR